jgi:hypothetical protein
VIVTALFTARITRTTPPATPRQDQQTPSRAFTTAELRGKLTGTFVTPKGARLDLSFTFNFPLYELGPSTTTVWTNGTTGTWDIDDSHPLLTSAQRAKGWHMMLMTAPGDATKAPARVSFTFDTDGQIIAIEFASFLGIEFGPEKHMFLNRKNVP